MGEWDRQAIMALAQKQHGVLSRQQLFENSVTRRQLDRRVESNEWERLLPQVYRLAGTVRSFLQRAWACSLWAGADAYLSHHAAAWLWGFIDIEPQRIDLSADFKLHQPAQWVIAHKTNVPKAQRRERRGLPVTSPSRTLVDLASHLSIDQREAVFATAFRSRLADQFELANLLKRLPPSGRKGTGIVSRYLETSDPSHNDTHELERRAIQVFAKRRFPKPVCQFRVIYENALLGTVDFAWPEHRIIIEADSFKYHSGRKAFCKDLHRYNSLTFAGWTVGRLTWDDVTLKHSPLLDTLAQRFNR